MLAITLTGWHHRGWFKGQCQRKMWSSDQYSAICWLHDTVKLLNPIHSPGKQEWQRFPHHIDAVRIQSANRCKVLFKMQHIRGTIKITYFYFYFLIFPFIFISWRLITLQYCSGFCHTLTWISHEFTCIPHPDPPSHLPLHLIPLGLPSAPGPSTCLMHPAWAGDLFHPR